MSKIQTHPAPEKLLRQVTVEVLNGLAPGEPADHPSAVKLETAVKLIAKAWELPQTELEDNLDLIRRKRQNILKGSSEEVLPGSENLEPYNGPMIIELLWGLFETAIKLEDAQERAAVHEAALLMADCLILDDWVMTCESDGPGK